MATQALFYERATPVSSQRHRDWCVIQEVNYEFARRVNAVPLMTVEMAAAAREYTIVFASAGDALQPIVLLGVENDENVYVTEEGGWAATYIPAFVRRYPFVFSRAEDADRFTLCIDESWTGCNQDGRGEPLFDEQVKGTPYLDKMFGFVKEYQRQAQRTQDFCHKLKELDLLESNRLQFTLAGGEQKMLGGFMSVSQAKLKALPAETLWELAQSDELQLIYTHLQAMNNFSLMFDRVARSAEPATVGASAEADS